jgi:hypothetical protein
MPWRLPKVYKRAPSRIAAMADMLAAGYAEPEDAMADR